MRATRRQEIPRGLHIRKCFKNNCFFLVFGGSHDEGDCKTRDSKRAAYSKILQKPFVFFRFFEGRIMRATRRQEIPRGLHIPKSLTKTTVFSRFFEGRMMRATRRQEIPRRLHIPKCFKNHEFFKVF